MRKAPNTFQNNSVPRTYVAGLGRGANAFQTSAANGVISVPTFGAAPAGYIAGSGRGSGGFGEKKPEAVLSGSAISSTTTGGRFDKLLGYEGSLFESGEYGSEDQYADAVYASVEELRKVKPKRTFNDITSFSASTSGGPNTIKAIADNFADLKTKLKQVSAEDWGALPEAHSRVKNYKKNNKPERFTPVTDSMLATAASMATSSSKREDLSGFSAARDQMLRLNLDRAGDSVTGQTVVDPRGVLTAISGELDSAAQLGDVKKARLLLKSVTMTNPVHGPGWIAAARIEELAGKISEARDVMRQAREACEDQEDVWLESARIETPNNAKAILAQGVARYLPESISMWLAAADLEISAEEAAELGVGRSDKLGSWTRVVRSSSSSEGLKTSLSVARDLAETRANNRKTLLVRALEKIPDSIKLWASAYAMETNDDKAKELLLRATQCCPSSVDPWISLGRLEKTQETAQKCLNEARKRFPGEIRIWIVAARLVEEGDEITATKTNSTIIAHALKKIAAHVDRTSWLKQAEECETLEYPKTCESILRTCLGFSIELEDRMRTWLADANSFEKRSFVLCAEVCLELLIETFPSDDDVWLERIGFEKRKGKSLSVETVLKRACTAVENSQLLWLMYAKEVWTSGDLQRARRILEEAFEKLKDTAGEEMWFAAAKLAQEVSLQEARDVFAKARQFCPDSERVCIKSIVFERKMRRDSQEEKLIREALAERFPKSEKLWMMLGQVIEWSRSDLKGAKEVYSSGLDACQQKSVKLWLCLARVEERLNSAVTSRAILANARTRFPTHPEIWLASVRLEKRAGEPTSVVDSYLARALQVCPDDGGLLAEQIELAPEAKKESIAKDAFAKSQGKDVKVVLAVARVWWRKRPLDSKKVKKWLERAVALHPKFGDAWASLYRFHETERDGEIENIIKRCIIASPTHGEKWIQISKERGNEDLKTDEILIQVAKKSGPDDSSVE